MASPALGPGARRSLAFMGGASPGPERTPSGRADEPDRAPRHDDRAPRPATRRSAAR